MYSLLSITFRDVRLCKRLLDTSISIKEMCKKSVIGVCSLILDSKGRIFLVKFSWKYDSSFETRAHETGPRKYRKLIRLSSEGRRG